MYYKIEPRFDEEGNQLEYGVAVSKQLDINGFSGVWVVEAEGFDLDDWYSEENGWSKPILTTEEQEAEARQWRDRELEETDFIVPLSDYPNRDAWLTYRQQLRDWTATDDFPETKPVAP